MTSTNKPYEFLDHTADVKFRAYGKTLEEAFANAAKALFSVITDINNVKPKYIKRVGVKSTRLRSLLYDFLEELVTLQDTEGFLLHDVESLHIDKDHLHLSAALAGDTYQGQYDIACHIKAVTYSDMEIKKEGNTWVVQVVPDI
ncbi:archease [Candidatus Woesearchaeota archaeon]|nr:MAG: archease [Candidatus Woesearchaeota archaeon]